MAVKTLNVRHQLRLDTLANWELKNPVLLAGELAIAAKEDGTVLLKVGDGAKSFKDLPWLSGLSDDIYAWAKAATKPTYTVDEIEGLKEAIEAASVSEDGILAALGFSDAENGAQLVKGADGSVKWVVPDATTVEGLSTSVETLKTDMASAQGALEVLKGNAEEEGSVAYQIAQIVAGADENFDTLKEIADWIKSDTIGAAKIANDVNKLTALVGETSVADQIAQSGFLKGIEVNGENATIVDNIAKITMPQADDESIEIKENKLSVKAVEISKVFIGEGNELILDGGKA